MPVVEATFSMVADMSIGAGEKERLERAMVLAIQKTMDEGITDVAVIRRRILEARDKVRGD
jgi:hypothetical protein